MSGESREDLDGWTGRLSLFDLVERKLSRPGGRMDLDEFGVEWVERMTVACGACGSTLRRTHGGWGSICWACGERWD